MTFPGTVASLRQMWGRAGRRGRGLAVYVAGEDALDQFFCRHPDEFLERPVEAAIVWHENEPIHLAHLLCAAHEGPLGASDAEILGPRWQAYADLLVSQGELVERRGQYLLRHPEDYPAARVSLRSASRDNVAVVDTSSGELLGTVETSRAANTIHDGAIYLHLGRSYEVAELDLDGGRAFVAPFDGNWYTQPKRETDTEIERLLDRRDVLGVTLSFGRVTVTEQVHAYQRKRLPDHEVLDLRAVDLPPYSFTTQALWYELGPALLEDFPRELLLGALHAAEHTQIAVLPLLAMCDRWDIGGLSTNAHPQTGGPTIFIYDGHPGGVGITLQGFRNFDLLVGGRPPADQRVPVRVGLPVVRAVAQVRQPQRAAVEGGRARGDGTNAAALRSFAEGCAGSNLCIDAHGRLRARGRPTLLTCQAGCSRSSAGRPGWPSCSPPSPRPPPPRRAGPPDPPSKAARSTARRSCGRARRGPWHATSAWVRATSSPPRCPSSRCASTRRAPARSGPASSSCRRPRPARSCGSTSAGSRSAGAWSPTWPAGTALAPGRYRVLLHVRGLRGTVLARKASTPGRATLTVRAPAPAPAPLPDPAGHVFPVSGPHTFGDGFGAPRNGYSHQGQDMLAAEGLPVVAPSPARSPSPTTRPSAAGYYIVEKGADGYDYFFAHCQKGSTAVAPTQVVAAGQQLCNVGATGDATGPHLHFEAWEGGWRVDAGSHPIDPLPLLQSWDVSAAPAAARR